METAIISPRYQVVIPPAARQSLGIKPGQKVQLVLYGDRLELIPLKSAKKMRGFLKGIDTTVEREGDRL